ncbi:MAG: DUF1631 family protein [Methylobacter sp.]
MTNAFLNNGSTITTEHRQPMNSGLSQIKAVFLQHFEQSVDHCCRRIDVEFGLQLNKNREKTNNEQYIKLLEYLRSVRNNIGRNYLSKVSENFDSACRNAANGRNEQVGFSNLSLVGDEARKENHAITLIIRQCEQLFYEELVSLNKYFAIRQVKHTIADSQNPVFPDKLVRALADAVKPLKLNTEDRITLYKTFEANVFNQLGFIYRELIKCCETSALQWTAADEINEEIMPAAISADQSAEAFRLLQSKLDLWRLAHFPSTYELISVAGSASYEHFEIKNALQILQVMSDGPDLEEKKQPLKWRVLKQLEELSFSAGVRTLSKQDEDVLDLAALIFSEIGREQCLEPSMKAAILRLEIPLAAASLGQYDVFTGKDNPVRRLIDDLFAAGLFLNPDEDDDQLIQQRIAGAVKKLIRDSGFELCGWQAEAGEFSNYLGQQKQRSRNGEEKAKRFMIDNQASIASRKIVLEAIENSMMGKTLPTLIVEFLRDVWSDVLLVADASKDRQPEHWQSSMRAMDELIISVMPPADDQQRKLILKSLPGLIAELRHGLKRISYEKSAQSRFFKELAVWHIILMDKKENALKDSAKGSVSTVECKSIKTETIIDDSSKQAGNLAEGSWVEFISETGRQWGKLLCKDQAGAMLFVGKNGIKIFEIQAAELAEKLRQGLATIAGMDEKTITERVLSALMSL